MARNVRDVYFNLQIKFLRWAGISLNEKETVWFQLYSYAMLATIFCTPFWGVLGAITNRDHMQVFIQNMVFGGAASMTFLKIFSIYLIRKKLGKAMDLLENTVFVSIVEQGREQEENILEKCLVYVKAQEVILATMAFIYSLSPNFETALLRISHSDNSSYWTLPFGDVSAVDEAGSPIYEIVWACQFVANYMACIGYISTNALAASVMAFLSVQCKLLQNAIKTSVERSCVDIIQKVSRQNTVTEFEGSKVDWKDLHKVLKEIVEYHLLITNTSNEFEDLFYIPTLMDFIGISIIICLALFYCILAPGLNYVFLQFVALYIGATLTQFMTSYWGNELTTQYSAIGRACNEVNFIGTDIRFQKGLCLIIQRSQKPIYFTVGKFVPLTLGTFITVMRAAYSYAMLLYNVGI